MSSSTAWSFGNVDYVYFCILKTEFIFLLLIEKIKNYFIEYKAQSISMSIKVIIFRSKEV